MLLVNRIAELAKAGFMGKQSLEIHNVERPRLSLQCKTPDEVHQVLRP